MADNYLQRSHRQDDSRSGNNDPLMELSRIMGTVEAEGPATESNDDFAMDLERELMGGFDEQAAPQSAANDADDQLAAQDFQESIERELAAEPSYEFHEAPVESVAAYEEPDYADYEPDPVYVDSEAGEGAGAPIEQAVPHYEERPAVAAPSLSLEDELETLLAGSAQPVVQRSANASWGYGSQTQVPGRTEIAPSISRSTSYQQPSHAPESVTQVPEPEPVAYAAAEEEQVQDAAIEDFDTDELMAAFDDFDVTSDQDEDSEPVAEAAPVFPLYQSVEQSPAPVHEPIEVPVATPVASAPRLPEVHELSDYADELDRAASAITAAPDVDTVAVTENRVDYTESLDLPAVNYEDDVPQHNGLNELDNEFAEVFGSIEADDSRGAYVAAEDPGPQEPEKDQYAEIFADVFGNEADQNKYNPAGYATAAAGAAAMAAASSKQSRATPAYGPEEDLDFGYDPRQDNVDIAATPYGQKETPARRRSNLFVPGVAAAVVLLAVAGAVAYKWTGGSNGEPVVIMADKTPIKVQPETASTAVVPNQDKAVYDKSATAAPEAPKQDQLVTTREDPIDLPADEDGGASVADMLAADAPPTDAPGAGDKVEARVDPATADDTADAAPAERNSAIAPRKVQTMVVKPDGTMVASIPEPADPVSAGPAAAPADRPAAPLDTNATAAPATTGDDEIGALMQDAPAAAPVQTVPPAPEAPAATAAAKPAPAAGKLPPKPVATKKITPETVASVTPKNIPVVESRPADQPIDIVDRVPPKNAAGQQVASAAPAAGSYLIQIASQPNVEGAQKTYASLSQKYAGVIGGRGVDIKQAEIAGKGTFFRVRIPAGSKSDANALCAKYKTAGGSCFVTQ
ncbi:SPOR domain-containing protein [Phyllobacterium bourgognense]|uniref:Sporulation related protein n=1 Tax=Phyllobacterium bourgognense TaxID=314236 RepID=A0A368Z255_9HYPH|nr:SPOR domain-containing protein [Phyllobacterium bourgognense]RCW86491.1 sporulation related protein [Phyllobacterium bourgognense]